MLSVYFIISVTNKKLPSRENKYKDFYKLQRAKKSFTFSEVLIIIPSFLCIFYTNNIFNMFVSICTRVCESF